MKICCHDKVRKYQANAIMLTVYLVSFILLNGDRFNGDGQQFKVLKVLSFLVVFVNLIGLAIKSTRTKVPSICECMKFDQIHRDYSDEITFLRFCVSSWT